MFLCIYVHLYVNTCVHIYMWRPENTLRFYSQECHVPETGSLSGFQAIKYVKLGCPKSHRSSSLCLLSNRITRGYRAAKHLFHGPGDGNQILMLARQALYKLTGSPFQSRAIPVWVLRFLYVLFYWPGF